MGASEEKDEARVQAWCRWYDSSDPGDEWAEQEVIEGIIGGRWSVEEAWTFVMRLLRAAPNDRVLGIIGASPIEDLLSRDPSRIAGWLEAEAPNNRPLRLALVHTWQFKTSDEIFERVKRLANEGE